MLSGFRGSTVTLLFTCLTVLGVGSSLRAQNSVSTGIVAGRVEDPAGSVVTGAVIELMNTDTGYKQANISNDNGLFTFPAVPSGPYSVLVSAPGFRSVQVKNVAASVGQTSSVVVRMELGDTKQEIEVSAEAEILNTTDVSVSSVVGQTMIQNLPTLRRQYTDFALLSPSVTVDGQFGSVSFAGSQGDYTSNYRNGNGGNSFSVDGANATSRYLSEQRMETRVPYVFGSESVQEFQVAVNPYSPAYGGGAAGYVNTVTKSGTNAIHGAGFYYNRNTGTGAVDAVSKAAGYPKAFDVRQQFGAAVGGPVIRNKLFFFFDYEQQRRKNPISILNPAMQAVNATSFGVPAGTVLPAPKDFPVPTSLTVADPTNPIYLQGVSNALNQIQSQLGFYPRRQDDLVFFQRGDFMATDKDRILMRYNYNTFRSPGSATSNPIPGNGRQASTDNAAQDHDALIHWMRTVSPTFLVDTRLFYSRNVDQSQPTTLARPEPFPGVRLTVPSSFSIGRGALSAIREFEWGFSEHFSWSKGRHTFDFGGDITHDTNISVSYSGYNGAYTFPSLSAFALGQYSLYTQNSGQPVYKIGYSSYGFYFGDTYKVAPKLTLNLGIRQDWQQYPQPPLNPALPLTGTFNNDYKRWAPRVGFAYHALPKTVVRGGIGVFRAYLSGRNYIASTTTNGLPSLRSSLSLNYNTALTPNTQAVVFPNVLPANSPLFAASTNVNVIDPGLKTPATISASLQVEQQVGSSMTVSVGSIWAHSQHLISSSYYDLNQVRPTGTTTYYVCPAGANTVPCATDNPITKMNLDAGAIQEGARFPGFGQVNALVSPGNSNYTSGYIQVRQNMRKSLSATFTYTLSKNNQSNGFNFANQWDFSDTKGPSLLDQRHKIILGFVFQPKYTGSGIKKPLLSNWMISTLTQYGSGRPYAGVLSTACVGASLATCRGGSNINDSAFNYGHGIAGAGPSPDRALNSFVGPWSGAVDLSVERSFKFGEFGSLMFRATGFNMMNHPNYYVYSGNGINQQQYRPVGPNCGDRSQNQTCYLIPNNTPGGFGTFSVVQQNTGPRIMQFTAIYRF